MRRAWHALAAYTVMTLAATWPLAGGLARDVAGDLGDSLLNMWILSWDCEQLLAILHGDVSRVVTFFDANIFHPAPLALAYSEHLLPQALQVLPIYALTGNPILCYNLLFLSTFVLSALGMYLLVRQLTGNALAAFVAGLLFAFAPYRLPQSSHVQVLSSQWMPFVLYGIRRYFDGTGGPDGRGRNVRPLLWAAVALAVQNLSCGYYLLYFAPFAAVYALWEMVTRRAWTERRTWMHLAAAGFLVAAITAPFLLPYAEVRTRFDMARTPTEVARLSADVYAYATAYIGQPLWGSIMRAMPRPEGELFPGLVPIVLGVIGLLFGRTGIAGRVAPRSTAPVESRVRRAAIVVFSAAAVMHLGVALATIALRRINLDMGVFQIRIGNVTQMLVRAAAAYAVVLALSSVARQRCAAFLTDRGVFFVGLIAAFWLSLGPVPHVLGRPLDIAAPYRWLFEYVPGFEGLRTPARFGMIVTLMLAVLGGYGAAVLSRRSWGPVMVSVVAVPFLFEGTAVPFLVNGTTALAGYHSPEARVYPPDQAPPIYRDGVRRLGPAVLAELPLGEPEFDLRATYYTTAHWSKLINGYSGFYPPQYGSLVFALRELPLHPALSMDALRVAGATHVIVHEGAYLGREGEDTSAALRAGGAIERYRDGGDALLALPR